MASLTFDEIVTDGMLMAGRDDLAEVIRGRFNDWLDRQARSWPWPALTTVQQVEVPAGTLILDDALEDRASRVLDECWLYRTDNSGRGRLRIMQVASPPRALFAENDAARGMPTQATLFPGTSDLWTFAFNVRTDRAYNLTVPSVIIPERIADPWTTNPWYPQDDTCKQAVMVATLLHVNGADDSSYQAALGVLSEMVQVDRVRHGVSPSQNNILILAGGVFR